MLRSKFAARKRRHWRLRKRVTGTAVCPRLVVYRSNRHFYAQAINDQTGMTLFAFSTLKLNLQTTNATCQAAKMVALQLAKLAHHKQLRQFVFDRAGFLYHGQIATFVETIRAQGLKI